MYNQYILRSLSDFKTNLFRYSVEHTQNTLNQYIHIQQHMNQ